MTELEPETTTTDYLAILLAELDADSEGHADAPAGSLAALVAQLLARNPGELAGSDLAAYYDQSLSAGEREAMQRSLASDPAALAELIALDEVCRAYEAAFEEGVDLPAEEAGFRAAAAAGELSPSLPSAAAAGEAPSAAPVEAREALPAGATVIAFPARRRNRLAAVTALAASLLVGVFFLPALFGPSLPDEVVFTMGSGGEVVRGGYVVGGEYVVEAQVPSDLYWAVVLATDDGVEMLVPPTLVAPKDRGPEGLVGSRHVAAAPLGGQAIVVLVGETHVLAAQLDEQFLAPGAGAPGSLRAADRLNEIVHKAAAFKGGHWKAGVVKSFVVSESAL